MGFVARGARCCGGDVGGRDWGGGCVMTKRGAVVCAMLGVTLSRSALAAFVAQCIALT